MESLASLNTYTASLFEMWLYDRLRLIYTGTPEEKHRASNFNDLGVARGESHIDALENVFNALSDEAKEQFRLSLSRLLRYALPSNLPCEAVADIIMLAGITNATKSFSEFAPVLGNGKWGEIHPSLIYDALSVLLMVKPSDAVYESAKGLSLSKYFPGILSFDAYQILLKCRPDAWRDDFELFREQFSRVITEVIDRAHRERMECLQQRINGLSEIVPDVSGLFDELT